MDPYTPELRGEILAACDADEVSRDIALRFKVSKSWVRRIKLQRPETGHSAGQRVAEGAESARLWAGVARFSVRVGADLRSGVVTRHHLRVSCGPPAACPRSAACGVAANDHAGGWHAAVGPHTGRGSDVADHADRHSASRLALAHTVSSRSSHAAADGPDHR